MSVIFAKLSDWLKRPSVEEELELLHKRLAIERNRFEIAYTNLDMDMIHATALELQKLSRQLMLCDMEGEL